ncbi:polysaccharide ABC transporter ATP-binding protein [Hylemonella sp. W303a]|uniref:ABC transporter ATP-binding protein n=1 Tax=Hylemonella sp. W303a TaxID=3389873 RepID=UPI00396B165C
MTDDTDICVAVHDVSKKFARSLKRSFIYGARDIGRLLTGRGGENRLLESEFWAVRNVSLELRRGRSIGIVGLNGSGKTTLLRMISGILKPTLGHIEVNGRIAPMLALGAGFKPVLSGRENIFLNLALLGVAERDIRQRFDSIVDFAELHEAIEAPIGTYSSGMLARLGFACAVHTDPQILVVDEVLSVGDTKFRMKCRNRINELRRNGTSMLLVSHSTILIETLSDECLFLSKGKVSAFGAPTEVLRAYEDASVAAAVTRNLEAIANFNQRDADPARELNILSVKIGASEGIDQGYWVSGLQGGLRLELDCRQALDDLSVNLMFFDLTHQPGETVQFMMSGRDQGRLTLGQGKAELSLSFPTVGLRPGTYRIKVSVSRGAQHDMLDVIDNVRLVVRDTGRTSNCLYFQSREWSCVGGEFNGVLDPSGFEEVDPSEA